MKPPATPSPAIHMHFGQRAADRVSPNELGRQGIILTGQEHAGSNMLQQALSSLMGQQSSRTGFMQQYY